jgi:type II secretory pathway predicted ATPase ExeA
MIDPMRSEVMKYHGLTRDILRVGYFETEQQREVFADITAAIHSGKLVAVVGIVGCGKTTTLHRLIETLKDEKEILVSQSLAVDKDRVSLGTLMTGFVSLLALTDRATIRATRKPG